MMRRGTGEFRHAVIVCPAHDVVAVGFRIGRDEDDLLALTAVGQGKRRRG